LCIGATVQPLYAVSLLLKPRSWKLNGGALSVSSSVAAKFAAIKKSTNVNTLEAWQRSVTMIPIVVILPALSGTKLQA
jgi:hypothetical protein